LTSGNSRRDHAIHQAAGFFPVFHLADVGGVKANRKSQEIVGMYGARPGAAFDA